MPFYERYVELCAERDMKPQNPEMQRIAGVSSGAISGWKKGADPKIEVLVRLSKHFGVTTDYLLDLSEVRNCVPGLSLSDMEQLLIDTFRAVGAIGQANIIHACLTERDEQAKKVKIDANAVG